MIANLTIFGIMLPNYMFMKEMGSMEGVVLMMHTALDWALYSGSYSWFNTLLEFMILIGQGTLAEKQIYTLRSNLETSQNATQVALTYGDFRRDNTLYKEAEDAAMVARLGEIKKIIPMHYGSPVITERCRHGREDLRAHPGILRDSQRDPAGDGRSVGGPV